MEDMTGWPAYKIVGHGRDVTVSETNLPLFDREIAIPENSSTDLVQIHCRDGRSLGAEAGVTRLPGKGDRALVSILRIITRTAARGPGYNLEDIESLTGLMSPDAFFRQINSDVKLAWETASPLAMILADVDHLRTVNDMHGRQAGDMVLAEVADILRVTVGDERFLGRLGEDDFAILLPDAGRGEARQLAATLRSTVERHRFHGAVAGDVRITMSLGAASFPADAETPEDLLSRAREALAEARSLGRNRVWCYLRRPRVPVEVPVFFDGTEGLLVGYTRDLSPSGIFVQTAAPIDIGMRCALSFPLPGHDGNVHVIGRIVRTVPPDTSPVSKTLRIPGMGVEFEQFGGPEDRHAIELFLHHREATTLRPEKGNLSGL
jgi:diguanylate cyclase (GGDEF)-like protein